MDISTDISGPLSVATTPEGLMREPDEVTAMLRLHRLGWGTRRIATAFRHAVTESQAVPMKGTAPTRGAAYGRPTPSLRPAPRVVHPDRRSKPS